MKRVANASLVFGAALALSLVGCHVTHPDLPAAAFVLAPAPVTVSALVTDAATGLPVASTLSIYSQTGTTPIAGPMKSTTGVFTYVPGNITAPVTYRLVAAATGYGTAAQNLTVTTSEVKADGSGLAFATIALNSTAGSTVAPAGLATVTTNSSGSTAADITSTTQTTSGIVGAASVLIPASTVITSASGAPLVGTVSLVTSYSNALTPGSLAAFPSSTQAIVNGTPTTLISAGAITTTATDGNGGVAKNFSPAVKVTIPVPVGTINPTTNAAVKATDQINIYDIGDDGLLVPLTDANGPVIATLGPLQGSGTTGYFPATFSTTHFCSFNAAWPTATSPFTLTVGGTGTNPYNGLVYLTTGGWWGPISVLSGSTGTNTFTFTDAPASVANGVSILIIEGGTVHTYTVTGSGQTIDTSAQSSTVIGSLAKITVNAVSPHTTAGIPSAVVVAKPNPFTGTGIVVGATGSDGTVMLELNGNSVYDVTAFYNGLTSDGAPTALAKGATSLTLQFTVTAGYTGITGISFQ